MFVQKNDTLRLAPPGPIKNESLEDYLVFRDNEARLKKNVDFYMLTKDMWDFFFNIYGGGPTILIKANT